MSFFGSRMVEVWNCHIPDEKTTATGNCERQGLVPKSSMCSKSLLHSVANRRRNSTLGWILHSSKDVNTSYTSDEKGNRFSLGHAWPIMLKQPRVAPQRRSIMFEVGLGRLTGERHRSLRALRSAYAVREISEVLSHIRNACYFRGKASPSEQRVVRNGLTNNCNSEVVLFQGRPFFQVFNHFEALHSHPFPVFHILLQTSFY